MITTITIPDERPTSWNKFYSGRHWASRKKEADRVHTLVRAHLPHFDVYTVPVDITVTVHFKNRPLDPDNIPAKLYIDGLCGWLIPDDTRKQINEVTTQSRVDKARPRLTITIREAQP